MQKFVELRRGLGSINDWYVRCQKDQIPYVVVDKSKRYAVVRWDSISFAAGKTISLRKTKIIIRKKLSNFS